MQDKQGRTIDYIRISVTDRCNLRCVYCMPEEGISLANHGDILTYDEILRLCRILADTGIKKVKLTGGEPLARKDLPYLVKAIKDISGISSVTVTTNGILLKDQMKDLAAAGISAVNISLDTLDAGRYAQVTRRNLFDKAWEGILEALKYADIPVKINCVPVGMQRQDLLNMASLARDYRLHVRFIEMMPIGYGKQYESWRQEDIIKVLEETWGSVAEAEEIYGNGPGRYYSLEGFSGKIGFISAMSHKFCDTCNRVRLTAKGRLKTCLQYEWDCDLRALLRGGAGDAEIADCIRQTISRKPAEHHFLSHETGEKKDEAHSMAQIGG